MSKYDAVYFVGNDQAINQVQIFPKRVIEVHIWARLQPYKQYCASGQNIND